MTKEEFVSLVGKEVIVDYDFNGELQHWDMTGFYLDEFGEPHHEFLPLIMDVFIPKATNPRTIEEIVNERTKKK